MGWYKKFLQNGISEDRPYYINNRIRQNNMLILFLLPITIFYTIFSLKNFPVLTIIPALGIFLCITIFFMLRTGFHHIARTLTAILPATVVSVYHAFVVQPGEGPLISSMALSMSFVIIPFIIFDIRERPYLIGTMIYFVFLIGAFPLLNNIFHVELDSSIMRGGPREVALLIFSTMAILASSFWLGRLNLIELKRSEQLRTAVEDSHKQLQASNRQLMDSQDEMKDYLEQLEANKQKESERTWANEGNALFSEILRSERDMDLLADKLIRQIVKYVNANQGSIFIVNEENGKTTIDLMACYAWDRKKYREKRIEPGEGLLGQCYLEKEYIYMTAVPNEYVSISSGLGEANPSAVLIVPMMVDNKVHGLFELASFQPFAPHEIDFLNHLGEIIGSTFMNIRVNQTTKYLLEESQQQSEELRAREEELRQNLEELQATQEEMQRINSKMEAMGQAINATIATAEFDRKGNFISVNNRFTTMLGFRKQELIQKKFVRVVPERKAAEYEAAWDNLVKGKLINGRFVLLDFTGKEHIFSGTFYPVVDMDGKVQKVIGLMYESEVSHKGKKEEITATEIEEYKETV